MYDPKLDYLVGEFSRARNKRYESYVVNRIWGLVCDLPLRPRTQMNAKVRDEEGNATVASSTRASPRSDSP